MTDGVGAEIVWSYMIDKSSGRGGMSRACFTARAIGDIYWRLLQWRCRPWPDHPAHRRMNLNARMECEEARQSLGSVRRPAGRHADFFGNTRVSIVLPDQNRIWSLPVLNRYDRLLKRRRNRRRFAG